MTEPRAQSAAFAHLACELIASGKGFRFHARGRSMLPSIEDGDVLHVAPASTARLKIGDIVLFKKDGVLKAHRIVGKDKSKECFITRGDASTQTDGMVARGSIIGRIIAVESKDGRLLSTTTVSARVRFFAGELRRRLSDIDVRRTLSLAIRQCGLAASDMTSGPVNTSETSKVQGERR